MARSMQDMALGLALAGRGFGRMTDDEQEVLVALATHRGRAAAIHLPELAAQVGIHQREVQDIVKRLVEVYGVMVSRGEACGMYLIESVDEAERSAGNLWRRGISNLMAAAALRRMSREQLHAELDAELGKLPLIEH